MAKTVNARTIAVQSLDYKYGKIVVPPYEVDVEFTPQEEAALDSGITADMIPSDAGQSNKFATENYVNNKVATDAATFKGTYNLVSDLGLTVAAAQADIAAALATEISDADNNDYSYVQIPIDDNTPSRIKKTDRYKFDGTDWAYEFTVSNADLAPYRAFKPDWTTDTTLLAFCQDVIADPSVVVGDLFLGSLSCSGLPAGMSNGEVAVQVNQGLYGKLLLLTITSTNLSPYRWEQSFYNDTLYGWKCWLEAVNEDTLFTNSISTEQKKQAALMQVLMLEQMYGYTTEVSSNPEYEYVIVDTDSVIIAGKKVNGKIVLFGVEYD